MNNLVQVFTLDKHNKIIEYRDSTGIFYKNPKVDIYKGLYHLYKERHENDRHYKEPLH